MKKLILFSLFLAYGFSAFAQLTAVSGTIVDSDGTTWFNAKVNAIFVPNPAYPQQSQYNINGVPITSSTYSPYLNQTVTSSASGIFNITLLDNTKIAPIGSSWKFVIQSWTSAPSASNFPNLVISGGSQNISSFILANITAPRFSAISSSFGSSYGYGTNEVATVPIPGGSFFNVTNGTIQVWSCTFAGCGWITQITGNFCSVGGCTFTGNVIFNANATFNSNIFSNANASFYLINGIPQADRFPGSDFCAQLRNAEVYALANNITLVDATHFPNAVSCSTDPFVNLATAGTTINLKDTLPAARISSTVNNSGNGITINNNGIVLAGQGRGNTVWQYTGSTAVNYVFGAEDTNPNGSFIDLYDFSVIGNSNVTNDIYLQNWNRSELSGVSAWGATGCGIYTAGAVTDTFIKPHVSVADATEFGWPLTQTPANGICLDNYGGNYTTDGTVVDAAVEGVTGTGWKLIHSDNMTFTSGTSEENLNGVAILTGSKFNTFVSPDIEQNTANSEGVDINDNGQGNIFQNTTATSPCGAVFIGSISGTTLTVTSVTSGSVQVTQTFGSPAAAGTRITAGSGSTWTVSISQTVGSSTFTSVCQSVNAGGGGGQYVFGDGGLATGSNGFSILGVNSYLGVNNTGSTSVNQFSIRNGLTNNAGFQSFYLVGCNITAGAIGNACMNGVTFLSTVGGVNEPDTNYNVNCQAQGGTGSASGNIWHMGNLSAINTTGFIIYSVADTTTAVGGGTVHCIVTHP